MVVANFLLEPATQARAQDVRQMGNFTVLDLAKLSPTTASASTSCRESGAADQRRARHDAARAASVVDDADHGRVGAAVHEVKARDALRVAAPAGCTVAMFAAADRARGSLGTLLPAFGYLPAIGGHALSLDPWRGSSR